MGLVLPELAGRIDGVAVRVPTPNVSAVDLTFRPSRDTDVEEINEALRIAADGPLQGILAYETAPLVSIDFNHDPHSATVAAGQTRMVVRAARARIRLVRQRVGLLQPHGGHRSGVGTCYVSGQVPTKPVPTASAIASRWPAGSQFHWQSGRLAPSDRIRKGAERPPFTAPSSQSGRFPRYAPPGSTLGRTPGRGLARQRPS